MRIMWQSFVDNAPYLSRLEAYLNSIADSGTEVVVQGMSPPDRDFGRLTELRCSVLAVDNALQAEADGFDGFVLGHFQDPGLYPARSALSIPVVGAGEATLHWAAQLGRRLALITIDDCFEVWHYEQADQYGLSGRISHVVGMGAVPEDFSLAFTGDDAAYQRLRDHFVELSEPLVAQGADVLIPAGVLPGLLLTREHGMRVRHAPIVSCANVPLKCAEVAIKLFDSSGLAPSAGPSFAPAPQRAKSDFRALVRGGRGTS